MREFFTIKESTSVEIIEKKSKFIANLFYVDNKDEAESIIKEIKKKYHDARHNCVAYRIINDGKIIEKSSDDGEPSGTAGSPMLEILKKQNLCNVLVIVTRYFGGVLLGTGGLVRAYTQATINAIEKGKKVCEILGYTANVKLDYKNLESFKYYCNINNINIIKVEYLDVISCEIEMEESSKEKILSDIDNKNINLIKINILCKKLVNKSV